MLKGKINEIFVSVQGEGKYVGQQQCFVRFYDCNLDCSYCDTDTAEFKEYGSDELIAEIRRSIAKLEIRTVSLTGGEPLLQRDFLLEFLPKLKSANFQIYLETNGVLYDEVFDLVDGDRITDAHVHTAPFLERAATVNPDQPPLGVP